MATWKDRVKQAVSTGGAGSLVIGSASSGYQALAAAEDGKVLPYVIEDGTAWETGYGIYTHSGTSFARTSRAASSTGSALTVSTSAFLYIDLTAAFALAADNAGRGVQPGGRLTLTSGTPVTTADVSSATSIYYTPFISDVVSLWDGNIWIPTQFSETTLALGTITSGKNYDVFAYLSSGALALEMLIWTDDVTRATAITVQDGRYCKSGDKTRLYLGTFRTTSTTTTEDSAGGVTTLVGGKRFLWNAYNRRLRRASVFDSTSTWSYTTTSYRQARAQTGNKVEFVCGLAEDTVQAQTTAAMFISTNNGFTYMSVGVGIDSTSTNSAWNTAAYTAVNSAVTDFATGVVARYNGLPPGVGYHYLAWLEKGGTGGNTLFFGNINTGAQTGLSAEVMA